MIKIYDKKMCCGCTACSKVCAHEAITMNPDKLGFLYPIVDESKCVECGMCDKVCPILNSNNSRVPISSYAFMHKDPNIRKKSSTAGAFVALAERILLRNGIVFGCAFDADWSAKHVYIDNISDIKQLVGSKYIQSRMENSYKDCKRFLQEGRYVLFTGTPCQIAGLKHYLRKDYEKLLCVDVICHGVPAPEVWQKYLEYRKEKKSEEIGKPLFINNVNFRDKSKGWESYSLSLSFSDAQGNVYADTPHCWYEDLYMRSFLQHLNMRPSCFYCQFRNQKSGSDITIGDFWRYSESHPHVKNDKIGINAVIINTEKGKSFFNEIDFNGFETSYQNIVIGNPQLVRSHWAHINQRKFLEEINVKDFKELVTGCLTLSLFQKIKRKIKTFYMLHFK